MDTDLHAVVLASARLLLRPIVRVLLRAGVPFREFSELAKFAYVEIATNEFGIRGRPTNVSRTAILTGLNRRDVARIRHAVPLRMLDSVFMSPGSRILSGWHLDAGYLDGDGKPAPLSLEGDAPSFQSLVRHYAPDLPHIALFKELSAAGAIELSEDGLLIATRRSYIPRSFDPNQIRLWGSILHDMAATLAHNVTRSEGAPARFERRAIHLQVRRSAVPEFREFVEAEGQRFLERVDAWLVRNGTGDPPGPAGGESPPAVRLGAGAYLIEDAVVNAKAAR
ncbi:MAG: hypothetical protein KGL92_16670 [Gammaproteobacteria bacterium]|nr:hypothetical protein [Gammaproteobacteria bacterium]MDE2350137.1 hypothetical protein [Gammaproteobacteria bacterium]